MHTKLKKKNKRFIKEYAYSLQKARYEKCFAAVSWLLNDFRILSHRGYVKIEQTSKLTTTTPKTKTNSTKPKWNKSYGQENRVSFLAWVETIHSNPAGSITAAKGQA